MINREINFLEKTNWKIVRDEVKNCNPTLFSLIEALDPDSKLVLFKIKYPYGIKIIGDGGLQIPIACNQSVSLVSCLDKDIQKYLTYCSIPLCLPLNKDCEIFLEKNNRIIPLQYLTPGQFFGLFEALSPYPQQKNDPKPIWQVSAGARTLFMLSKISDATRHNRLKKVLHIKSEAPKTLVNQWEVFGEIANNALFKDSRWFSEILVFSNQWFIERSNDNAWLKFKNYLLELAWKESQILREKSTFGYLWEALSSITLKNFRTKPYLVETVKHLMLIATAARPGFGIAGDSLQAGPLDIVQKVYLETYDLKNYPPILMHPMRFLSQNKKQAPVYYSLAYPTVLHHDSDLESPHRTMSQLREIMRLMNIIQQRMQKEVTSVTHLLNKIKYDYFHSEIDHYGDINLTNNLVENKKQWSSILKKYPGKKFPITAPFFRGVVQISHEIK